MSCDQSGRSTTPSPIEDKLAKRHSSSPEKTSPLPLDSRSIFSSGRRERRKHSRKSSKKPRKERRNYSSDSDISSDHGRLIMPDRGMEEETRRTHHKDNERKRSRPEKELARKKPRRKRSEGSFSTSSSLSDNSSILSNGRRERRKHSRKKSKKPRKERRNYSSDSDISSDHGGLIVQDCGMEDETRRTHHEGNKRSRSRPEKELARKQPRRERSESFFSASSPFSDHRSILGSGRRERRKHSRKSSKKPRKERRNYSSDSDISSNHGRLIMPDRGMEEETRRTHHKDNKRSRSRRERSGSFFCASSSSSVNRSILSSGRRERRKHSRKSSKKPRKERRNYSSDSDIISDHGRRIMRDHRKTEETRRTHHKDNTPKRSRPEKELERSPEGKDAKVPSPPRPRHLTAAAALLVTADVNEESIVASHPKSKERYVAITAG